MAKPPEIGMVKTRLAVDTSNEFALEIYKELLSHTKDVVKSTGIHQRTYYAWKPEVDPGDHRYFIQQGGDLGEKMRHAFTETFDEGFERVVMIGADCPGLQESHLREGIVWLRNHDVVTGPAEDGGYYLIGMTELQRTLFTDLPWSTDRLHRLTKQRINEAGLSHHELELLFDVDRLEDLEKTTFTAQWIRS